VLIAGGRDRNHALASAELFDAASNTWSDAGSMGAARWLHAAMPLPGGQVLVSGGKGDADPIATQERYDPATNRWTGAVQ